MRLPHLVLIGVAIPLILTATVFAVPFDGSSLGMKTDAANAFNSKASKNDSSSGIIAAEAMEGSTHSITLSAEVLEENGLLAYKMESHTIDGDDVTDRYSDEASIPGPTIVINEGDEVFLTIENGLGSGIVSVHVHGVHYDILSDATLEHINGVLDEGATPLTSYTSHWIAGPGTVGTWPYHDHTFGGINGAEHKGLFGTLIVNPASGTVVEADGNSIASLNVTDIDKEVVLYLGDDAFWGMEINSDGEQTPLWTNPTIGAKTGDDVRFHLIALGTDSVHTFRLGSYKWVDPGTSDLINKKDIGPLENHAFTIKAKKGNAEYMDNSVSNKLMGMKGKFKVTDSGASSVPSPIPELF